MLTLGGIQAHLGHCLVAAIQPLAGHQFRLVARGLWIQVGVEIAVGLWAEEIYLGVKYP